MLRKILWDNQNPRQIWGAIIGAFLGLFLLFSALQLFHDIRTLTEGKGNDRYVLINKKVNIFNTLGASSAFTPEELDTLAQQSFVESIGKFTPNTFKVSASSAMMGFYTELFFEAIESEYLDIQPRKFKWKDGQQEIPIILSRDYLALYNFGFAPSQGLPQFTQNTIKKVSVDITLQGRGLRQTLTGRIVGFSDRINSVLVPQDFMDWANQKFGNNQKSSVSRVILATENPYSPTLQRYLKDNNFEVSSGKLIGGQVGLVINIILGLIAFIGLVITVLSILVFLLNFALIISRTSSEIGLLLQLGYQPKQISSLLIKRLFLIFSGVLAVAFVSVLIGHFLLAKWLVGQSFSISSNLHWTVWVAVGLVGLLFFFINKTSIERKVNHLFI
ncbi:MAG: hypothetical protein AAGJ18_31095 [Bacteroidota bacterium]